MITRSIITKLMCIIVVIIIIFIYFLFFLFVMIWIYILFFFVILCYKRIKSERERERERERESKKLYQSTKSNGSLTRPLSRSFGPILLQSVPQLEPGRAAKLGLDQIKRQTAREREREHQSKTYFLLWTTLQRQSSIQCLKVECHADRPSRRVRVVWQQRVATQATLEH